VVSRPQAGDILPGRGSEMSRKTTDIDTPGKHAPREPQVILQDGRVLYAQRRVRARRTVTAVLVVLGILVDPASRSGKPPRSEGSHSSESAQPAPGPLSTAATATAAREAGPAVARVLPPASGNRSGSGQDRRAISPKLLDPGYANPCYDLPKRCPRQDSVLAT